MNRPSPTRSAASIRRVVTWWGFKPLVRRGLSIAVVNRPLTAIARRLLGPRARRLPVRRTEIEGRAGGASFVLVDPWRCANARDLYWGRGRPTRGSEATALDLVVELCQGADRLLDIGAYTGMFSMAAARGNPSLRVTAFEITPVVVPLLLENCARNAVGDRVDVRNVGVGAPGGSARLPSRWPGSQLPTALSQLVDDPSGTEVRVEALDALVGRTDDRLVLKIDVETNEAELLRHAGATLESRPDIVCELLPGTDAESVVDLLRGLGYQPLHIRDGWLELVDRVVPSRPDRDWLFTVRSPATLPIPAASSRS